MINGLKIYRRTDGLTDRQYGLKLIHRSKLLLKSGFDKRTTRCVFSHVPCGDLCCCAYQMLSTTRDFGWAVASAQMVA